MSEKIPNFPIKVIGRAWTTETRALAALAARCGKPTDYGTLSVDIEDSELEAVEGLVLYTPKRIEVNLKP